MKHKLLLGAAVVLAYIAGIVTLPAILLLASGRASGVTEELSWSATTGWRLTCPEPARRASTAPPGIKVDGVATGNDGRQEDRPAP